MSASGAPRLRLLRVIGALSALSACASTATLAGCLLTTDLDGLSGSAPDDAALVDAASAADAPRDGSSVGADAGDAGSRPMVDGSGGFCAMHSGNDFCTDFDESSMLPAGWTTEQDDGALMWSSARSLSTPGALFAMLPRRATTKTRAQLTRSLGAGFRHVVLELDVYLDAPAFQSGDSNAAILELLWFSNTVDTGFIISVGNGYMTVGTPGESLQLATSFPYAKWAHVKVDLDPAGSLSGMIGDVPISQTYPPATPGPNPETVVLLGIDGFNFPVPAYAASYDNVLIDEP